MRLAISIAGVTVALGAAALVVMTRESASEPEDTAKAVAAASPGTDHDTTAAQSTNQRPVGAVPRLSTSSEDRAFAPAAQRPAESDGAFARRTAMLAAWDAFMVEAQVTSDQAHAVRAILYDAQIEFLEYRQGMHDALRIRSMEGRDSPDDRAAVRAANRRTMGIMARTWNERVAGVLSGAQMDIFRDRFGAGVLDIVGTEPFDP